MIKNYLPLFDTISPKITLFNNGDRRYSTTIGGIFTIIIYCVGIYGFINQLFSYINFDIDNIQYYRKTLDESEPYKLNNDKGSIFIYIDILTPPTVAIDIDLSKIRMIGLFNDTIDIREKSFFKHEHWLFGKCDSFNIDRKLKNLANNDLNKSMCVEYYYNTNTNTYYSSNDKNYKSPDITSSNYFNIYIYKCVNDSTSNQIYGNCSEENEIEDYIKKNTLVMKYSYLSHQINSNNHKNPNQLFISSIISRIRMEKTYSTNSVTFTPLIIERETGIFFDNMKIDKTYSYQGYKKSTENNSNTKDILNFFAITIENNAHYYKYSYKTIYDVFTKVTILIQVTYYILFSINYIINLFAANINIINIIFHKKLQDTHKIRQFFSNNYTANLANVRLNNKIQKINDSSIIKMFSNNSSEDNKLFNQGSAIVLKENISKIRELNNRNIQSMKKMGVYKRDYKYYENKILSKMKISIKDIILFFKYLVCNKWNNSPLLLFDSIQKKLISVEHLFQMHLLLLTLKKHKRRANMIDIYNFFYEQ